MPLTPDWTHREGPFTKAQTTQLLQPINPTRVNERGGRLNVVAADIRAHMNRIFGFGGWSGDLVSPPTVAFERVYRKRTESDAAGDPPTGQLMLHIGYLATYRLTVSAWLPDVDGVLRRIEVATFTESAIGDATMGEGNAGDAHDFAVKTAESQAMKRCAINLGDQFGLSLYRDGERAWKAIVGSVLVGHEYPEDTGQAPIEPTEHVGDEQSLDEATAAAVPVGENDWVDAARIAPDEDSWDRLYNAARAANQPQKVLEQMKLVRTYPGAPELPPADGTPGA